MSRTYRSQQAWRELIEQHEQSGQTQAAFCAERSINPKYFSLKRARLSKSRAETSASPSSHFVRVANRAPATGITLRIGTVCIELPVDFPLDRLSQLIHTVA